MMSQLSLRMLLADDDLTIRTLFSKRLSAMGYDVVGEAANGQEAVDLFRDLRPDILLLDINMPVKNGLTALREIIAEFPDACIIMATSFTDKELVEDCMSSGAAYYISKDSSKEKIKEVIEETWARMKNR